MKPILFFTVISTYLQLQDFDELTAMAGLWRMETPKGSLYEEWKIAKAGTITIRSYKVDRADTTLLENVTVEKIKDAVYYIPIVFGQNNGQPVPFKMISSIEHTFTFENKQHDYPQRVIYHRVNADSITARIEGLVNGELRSSDFHYRRIR